MNRLRRVASHTVDSYLQAHRHPWNRRLHYLAFLCATIAWPLLFRHWPSALSLALLHYALSAFGHYRFEHNHPGFYKRPWLGMVGGYLWFFLRTYQWLKSVTRTLFPK
ncbi:MAG TPA: Mpo1-like protein [Bacilli bacterium]|nr:Mpo1-like protein [Bacilli bacterium]